MTDWSVFNVRPKDEAEKLSRLSREQKIEFLQLSEEMKRRKKYNASNYFQPYAKQLAFMNSEVPQRCLGAGNQLGKTLCGSTEISYHATGEYPEWFKGRRFEKPVVGWVCGVTGDTVRDTTQKLLIGRIQSGDEAIGTGSIPREKILGMVRSRGTVDLMDHIKVKHKNGVSLIYLKSYAAGREKFQGETIDFVWFDEEPPMDIFSEGRTRTNNGQLGQFVMLTFTPLLGMTEVATMFYTSPSEHQKLFQMTIDDVDHYTKEEKISIEAGYPEYEREARAKGIPVLGSGRVFQFTEAEISEPHILYPAREWYFLNGLDFGWAHPQAIAQIVWDKDNDVIHVTRAKKEKNFKPSEMWMATKIWAEGVKTAWPHDGFQHDKSSGKQLAETYRDCGFDMLYEHATHDRGGFGLEAGILEMQERFSSGRLKIDETLEAFWEEYRLYHRKDGEIVKINDDITSAIRYAVMMKRYAEQKTTIHFRSLDCATGMP